jgi:hypothetical protein
MRTIIAATIALSLAGSAYAQSPALNLIPEKRKDPIKEMKDEEIDRAYRQTTHGNSTPAANSANDPWAAVRALEHPAKPSPKTASKPKPQAQAQAQPQPKSQSQSPWPAAPAAARPQSQAQSQPASNSPWPPAPTQR